MDDKMSFCMGRYQTANLLQYYWLVAMETDAHNKKEEHLAPVNLFTSDASV